MQFSRVSPLALRVSRLSTTAALRNLSHVRSLHVQVPASLYTVGSERIR